MYEYMYVIHIQLIQIIPVCTTRFLNSSQVRPSRSDLDLAGTKISRFLPFTAHV